MVHSMNDLSKNCCSPNTRQSPNNKDKNKIFSLEKVISNKHSVSIGIPSSFSKQRSIDEETMYEFPDSCQSPNSRIRLKSSSSDNRETIEVESIKKVSDARAMFENMSGELKPKGNTPKHITKAVDLNTVEKIPIKASLNEDIVSVPMHSKTRSLPVDVTGKDLVNITGTVSARKGKCLTQDSALSESLASTYLDEKEEQAKILNTATSNSPDTCKPYHYKSMSNIQLLDQQSFPSYSTDDVRYVQKSKSAIKNDPADELRQAANRYHQELIKNYPKFRHSIFTNDNAAKLSRKISTQPEESFSRGEPTRATIASTNSSRITHSVSVNNSSDLCNENNLLTNNNSVMGRLLSDPTQEASLVKVDEKNVRTRTWSNSYKQGAPLVKSKQVLIKREVQDSPTKLTEDGDQKIDEKSLASDHSASDTYINRFDEITTITASEKLNRSEDTQSLFHRTNSPECIENPVFRQTSPVNNTVVDCCEYSSNNPLYKHVETDIDSPEAEALVHQRALSTDSAVYVNEEQHKNDLNIEFTTSMSDLDKISLKQSAQSDSDDIDLLPPPPDDLLCDENTGEANIEKEKPQRTINRKKNNSYSLNSRNNSCVSTDSTTSTGTADSGIGVRSDISPRSSPLSNEEYFLNKPLYGSQECLDDDVAELDVVTPHSASTPDQCTDDYSYSDETDLREFMVETPSDEKTETENLSGALKLNDLDGEKSKLIESMREKINELRLQEQEITDEIRVNDNLGKMVLNMVESKATQSEFSKFELFIGELNKIVALLLSLTQRLHRYELMLQELDMSNEEEKMKKDGLISKIGKLQSQLEEACYLKDVNNKRGDNVAVFLEKYCTDDEISDYQYYIDMKSQLALMQSEIREKVKLGEERLSALERTGAEWEFG